MRIFASSDLHLDQVENRLAFEKAFPIPIETNSRVAKDCLILAGDICESEEQLQEILERLQHYYRYLVWTPGNHELWVRPSQQKQGDSSTQKYQRLLDICQRYGVYTPEDAFLQIALQDKQLVIAPMLLLYDYTFRPEHIPQNEALDWAMASNVLCSDEVLINSHPYDSIVEWCQQRIVHTRQKLEDYRQRDDVQLMLVNHFPLSEASFELKHIPRFSIWCGTRHSQNWHQDYPVSHVVSGHLHLPGEQVIDGVRFHEVSLGYPGQWDKAQNLKDLLVELRT